MSSADVHSLIVADSLCALNAHIGPVKIELDVNSTTTNLPAAESALFEKYYTKIGWRTGPLANPDVRKSVRKFWIDKGAAGAKWLAHRIGSETHVDLLEGVANLLADIGLQSIRPIIDTMRSDPGRDQAEALLKALGWIEVPAHAKADIGPLEEDILGKYLGHGDPDIRAAAAAATRILPDDRAAAILRNRLRVESDPCVAESIDELLQEYA